jgi:hypothetical protein
MSILGSLLGSAVSGAASPVLSLISTVASLFDKLFPDANEAQKEKFMLAITELQGQLASEQQQAEINAQEAASGSLFEGGWRAAIGWSGAIALCCHYTIIPLVDWIALLFGAHLPNIPDLGLNELMPLIVAMLGIHGTNVVSNHMANRRG